MKPFPRLVALLALSISLSVAAPGCIVDPVTGEKTLGYPISEEAEIEMGEGYAPSFRSMYDGAYPEEDLQRYCGDIVLGMARRSHRPDLPWEFTILNSSEVNAFALPGGKVFITRGLLHRLESEAQFAGVMGHEIGHVTHRHAAQAMGRSMLAGGLVTLAGIAAEQSESEWAMLGVGVGAVGAQLVLLHYDREQEYESDLSGVEYSYESGYDPRELAGVFRIFKELKGANQPVLWLSSHPLDDDRIEAVQKDVQDRYPQVVVSGGAGLKSSSPGWNDRIAKLRDVQTVYDEYDEAGRAFAKAVEQKDNRAIGEALEKYRELERRLPGHAVFPSAVGVALYYSGRRADAKKEFERATKLQDDLFIPHVYLARLAWDRNDGSTLHREAKRAIELFPHHAYPYFLEARMYDREGNKAKAILHYEQVMELAAEDSEEYRYSQSRLGELNPPPEPAKK